MRKRREFHFILTLLNTYRFGRIIYLYNNVIVCDFSVAVYALYIPYAPYRNLQRASGLNAYFCSICWQYILLFFCWFFFLHIYNSNESFCQVGFHMKTLFNVFDDFSFLKVFMERTYIICAIYCNFTSIVCILI